MRSSSRFVFSNRSFTDGFNKTLAVDEHVDEQHGWAVKMVADSFEELVEEVGDNAKDDRLVVSVTSSLKLLGR